MTQNCDHTVGYIPNQVAKAKDWNQKLIDFIAAVEDFNVRGQRDQITHPGTVQEAKFCADCGAKIDRVAMGLLTLAEAHEFYLANLEHSEPTPAGSEEIEHGNC
ncbi:hypothetical protein ACI77O_12410 [Pseudomonas tritici]|uniref:hypothetical protein n=1 Tax=Pseudomonas tritici TaxID=2745518 RepID=UPI00387AE1D8